MSIFEHWQSQKETLRSLLDVQSDLSGVIYQVRHAVLQTEQNALAELSDDVLRQQAGVLMSCIKNSIALMEVPMTSEVWTAQKQDEPVRKHSPFVLIFSGLMLLLLVVCILVRSWLCALLGVCALISGLIAMFPRKQAAASPDQEVRVTLKPDSERLFAILDGQMRAADRYLNDYSYLNDQLRGTSECTDPDVVLRTADLLEALYECDETQRAPADDAVRRLMECLGLRAVDYSPQTSKLFNVLPSKNTTQTIVPAILSISEQRLLKRGTAADKISAA